MKVSMWRRQILYKWQEESLDQDCHFEYICSELNADAACINEIKWSIIMAETKFGKW